ncbi:MAG: hypothetical protein A2Y62_01940 [Candidatus Fischerbacteria bacterium RBG_13_37_8]|uniref:Uncharacterized protein n=1 Tax=Candidatus Fischerbacteria bacterium RBG_13_37_8 TaxID=1817863 RepID=A0A1F5VJM6_9BACT|nr:MAG: hypothetical protein A2Y62_01940 [Candidatus Fischerbacteria bacterium RBG_13_37_8]
MNKVLIRIVFMISIFIGIMILAVGCGSNAENKAAGNNEMHKVQDEQKVKTALVEIEDFQPMLQATGTLVPRRYAELKALVGGEITSLPVDIGTKVQKGQLLFEIRKVNYELDLEQADANLARAQVIVADREREKNRIENLFKEGSATEQMRDQTITGYEEALAAQKQAQAARDRVAQMLTDCSATAPYNGVVTARHLQQGEYVNSADPVMEIMDLSILNAEMEIPEPYTGKINTGLAVTVSFLSDFEPVEGKVIAVNPKIDTMNRTFLVKVAVDNSNGRLHAGLFCTATFALPAEKDNPSVPAESIVRDEGRSYVWVIADGKAHSREVKEGVRLNGRVMILSGLQAGEKVVVSGGGGLTEGTEIKE